MPKLTTDLTDRLASPMTRPSWSAAAAPRQRLAEHPDAEMSPVADAYELGAALTTGLLDRIQTKPATVADASAAVPVPPAILLLPDPAVGSSPH